MLPALACLLLLAAPPNAADGYREAFDLLGNDEAAAVARFREAAAVGPVDWGLDEEAGMEAELPWLGPMRRLMVLNYAAVPMAVAEGDLDAAADAIVAHVAAARHLGSLPTLTGERAELQALNEAAALRAATDGHLGPHAEFTLLRRLAAVPESTSPREAAARGSTLVVEWCRRQDVYPFAEFAGLGGETLDRWDYRLEWAMPDRRAALVEELERLDALALAAVDDDEAMPAWQAAYADAGWLARPFGIKPGDVRSIASRQREAERSLLEVRR